MSYGGRRNQPSNIHLIDEGENALRNSLTPTSSHSQRRTAVHNSPGCCPCRMSLAIQSPSHRNRLFPPPRCHIVDVAIRCFLTKTKARATPSKTLYSAAAPSDRSAAAVDSACAQPAIALRLCTVPRPHLSGLTNAGFHCHHLGSSHPLLQQWQIDCPFR